MTEKTKQIDANDEFAQLTAQAQLPEKDRLGVITGGSLSAGLDLRVDGAQPLETLAVGRYVVVHSGGHRFFTMIKDVALDNNNPELTKLPPPDDDFLQDIYRGVTTFGKLSLMPLLVIRPDQPEPAPVKTVPRHFAPAYWATNEDIEQIFGREGYDAVNKTHHFFLGTPLEMDEQRVTIGLERLVERSVGIFGKTGTGKSFLTRILLAGLIQEDVAVSLIFDMHGEYGWKGLNEGTDRQDAKGLKALFPGRVGIFSVDERSSRQRQARPDGIVRIAYAQVKPRDIEMLRSTLELSEPMVNALYALHDRFGDNWLESAINLDKDDLDELVEEHGQHAGSLRALQRRLEKLKRFPFLVHDAPENSVDKIFEFLQADKSVVLEFGRYGSNLAAYIFVANYLSRRIHDRYMELAEQSEAAGSRGKKKPLVVVIEEAHKFLDPAVAAQTIFGVIAREMRKYAVTLMVVDQRPSGIDEEVMSQIGTRITALLDDDADIRAVLSGTSGAAGLRQVLASLETKQQVLILGHAMRVPIVLRPRDYGLEFYKEVGAAVTSESFQQATDDLYGDEEDF